MPGQRVDVPGIFQPFNLGPGTVEEFTITNPGAGNAASRIVGNGYYERLLGVNFSITTSAVANTRVPRVVYQDGDQTEMFSAISGFGLVASSTCTYSCLLACTTSPAISGLRATICLPPVILAQGFRFVLTFTPGDGGDVITLIRGLVERFPIGSDGYLTGEPGNLAAETMTDPQGFERGV